MRILILSQYFWPETFIINDLVKLIAADGHTVRVITGKPNYPAGRTFSGYCATEYSEERFDKNVTVCRVPLKPRGNAHAKDLLLNYFSFVYNAIKFSGKATDNQSFDIIFVFAPSPITAVLPGIWLKWRLKSHLAVWVQDLWPESLSATGFIKNRIVLKAIGLGVRFLYACVDTLLVQSRAFFKPMAKYTEIGKVFYYPNSMASSENSAVSLISDEVIGLLENSFCIVFAGNLGKAQSLETLVSVSVLIQHLAGCKIVVIGDGSMFDWLKNEKESKHLDNLELLGRYAPDEMPHFFAKAAGLLVTLRKDEIFAYTIPSKVQAYLSAGRPILAALDGEGARLIDEAQAGFTCGAEDAEGLAAAIQRLYEMSDEERVTLGNAGKVFFEENFNMSVQSKRLIEIFHERLAAQRSK